jgi:hypothetical protein
MEAPPKIAVREHVTFYNISDEIKLVRTGGDKDGGLRLNRIYG